MVESGLGLDCGWLYPRFNFLYFGRSSKVLCRFDRNIKTIMCLSGIDHPCTGHPQIMELPHPRPRTHWTCDTNFRYACSPQFCKSSKKNAKIGIIIILSLSPSLPVFSKFSVVQLSLPFFLGGLWTNRYPAIFSSPDRNSSSTILYAPILMALSTLSTHCRRCATVPSVHAKLFFCLSVIGIQAMYLGLFLQHLYLGPTVYPSYHRYLFSALVFFTFYPFPRLYLQPPSP